MIYRIDIQHYVSHAIDYFTADELMAFQYAILSASIQSHGKSMNVNKINYFYPESSVQSEWLEYHNKEVLEKHYMNDLKEVNSGDPRMIYQTFLDPLLKHYDIMILCDKTENDYIDVLCKFLKKEFYIEVIDLNKLFSTGRVGAIYIDRDKIHDKAVDVRRYAAKQTRLSLMKTKDGRLKLVEKLMNEKEKHKLLTQLGIKNKGLSEKEMNELLMDSWVEDDE